MILEIYHKDGKLSRMYQGKHIDENVVRRTLKEAKMPSGTYTAKLLGFAGDLSYVKAKREVEYEADKNGEQSQMEL